MNIKTIRQIKQLKNKRVLLRVDFNVPVGSDMKVDKTEDYRLVKIIPTIKYLIKNEAKVILVGHLGRPDGKVVEDLRVDPVAIRLAQLLNQTIYKSDKILGQAVEAQITAMVGGEVLMLENVRFDKREEKGDKNFAQSLARLADIYVNDAFAANHRRHASTAVIQDYLPSYAGLLLEEEIITLSRAIKNPKKPLVVIIGGAKISTKIKVIKRFLKISDKILLGGALANTVLKAMGIGVGSSVIEPKMIPEIKKIKLTGEQLKVPVDGVLAKSLNSKSGRLDALGDIKDGDWILDIGPDTLNLYASIIKKAKTIVWNGPMGYIESPVFAKGTKELIKILSKAKAETIIGGGETVQMIRAMKLEKKFNFISTGGGAMLEFLEGKELPGLKKLIK